MDAPNAFAAGHRARRYCIPTIIQSNRVDCRPRPLGVRTIFTSNFLKKIFFSMDAPNAFAAGHRARRYCIPTIIQSNRVDCRPRPLGLKRSVSTSFATPVTKVTPFGGQYTPNWNYFYYNPRPSFNVEKTYFGDPRNVYWTGKHSNLPAINTFDRK
uniref:Uncharacterized protein n=1 Tax=Meloidogyne floridensis TaxID=298350 RepID=A0A915NL44_9BILA